MKSNFKRVVSLVLAVLMVFTVVPFSSFAAGEWDCSTDGHEFYGELLERVDGKHARWCIRCDEAFGYMVDDVPHDGFQNCYSGEAATCKQRATCDYCNREFGELADEHTGTGSIDFDKKFVASPATCKTGAYYWYKCSECGEPMYDRDSVQVGDPVANAHKYVNAESNGDGTHKAECEYCEGVINSIACSGGTATCTDKAICAYCGEEYGEANGHDYSEKIIDEAHLKTHATCKDKAVYWYDCKNCNANAKDDALAADKVYTDTNSTLKEHSFTANVKEPRYLETAGTCLKKATYYYSCSGCGLSSKGTTSQATFEGDFGVHSYTKENPIDSLIASQATCMAEAKYYKSCVYCGATSKDTDFEETFEYGGKADHNWGTYTYDDNAKCGVDGTETANCQTDGCNETNTRIKANTALEHKFTKKVTTHKRSDATCTAKATYWLGCSNGDCNVFASEETASDKYFEDGGLLEHNFTAETVDNKYLAAAATCQAKAKYYKSCSECATSAKDIDNEATFEYGPLASHDYTREVEDDKYNRTEATCLEQATRWYVCATCDKSAKDVEGVTKAYYSYGDLKAHNYSQEVRDDKYIVEGHEATCTTDAIYWYVCSQEGCTAYAKDGKNDPTAQDKFYTAKDTATGHDPEEIAAVEPTCTKAGSTAGSRCKKCKNFLVEPQERAALGHTEYIAIQAEAATCSKPGHTEEKRCAVCDALLSTLPSMTTKALGHVDSDGDGVCDREGCYTIMEDVVECSCICHQSGLIGVIAYIVILIWKLLGVNQYCDCGVQHY